MNEPLDDRERRIQRMAVLWGFIGGITLCVVAGLVWEILT